ncbi:MAG: hypothetical protein HC886_09590 [Leptolyngbyaceae cyanobacterium SM1_1_3]|nr:hypothetical protein [Leptolyngbyaceae cyanobacterium SM1_1_3]
MGIGTALLNNLILEALQSRIPVRLRVIVVNPAKVSMNGSVFLLLKQRQSFFDGEKPQR